MKYIIFFIFVLFLVVFSACGENPTTPSNNLKDTTISIIEWDPSVVIFELSDTNSIISHSDDWSNIKFNNSNSKANNLKISDIFLIYNKSLKKVKNITKSGNVIEIETEYCTYTEAVKNCNLYWDKEIRWTKDLIPQIAFEKNSNSIQKVVGNSIVINFPVKDYKGSITLNLDDDALSAECEISKSNSDCSLKYSFEATVGKIRTNGKINVEDHQLKNFEYANTGINGELTINLVATGDVEDLFNGVELPNAVLKFPLAMGGVLVSFNVRLLFVMNTKLSPKDASANIKTKFTFNSETGLSYAGSDVNITGSPGQNSSFADKNLVKVATTDAGVTSNFGVTFPRFELALLGETIVPFMQLGFLIGGSFTNGINPCMTIDSDFLASIGYKLSFLGLFNKEDVKVIWDKKVNIIKSGKCP